MMSVFDKWVKKNCKISGGVVHYKGVQYSLKQIKSLKDVYEKQKRAPGGGRKPDYGEPTKKVDFRCPKSKVLVFRKAANAILKSYVKELKPPTQQDRQ